MRRPSWRMVIQMFPGSPDIGMTESGTVDVVVVVVVVLVPTMSAKL